MEFLSSLIFASDFLCYTEQYLLENCPLECKLMVFRSYVNDIFVLFKTKELLASLANDTCSKHRSMESLTFKPMVVFLFGC